jgi:hypothetical protein
MRYEYDTNLVKKERKKNKKKQRKKNKKKQKKTCSVFLKIIGKSSFYFKLRKKFLALRHLP